MGEGEQKRRRMKGGEREGRRGHRGGLTACEYGLTSWVRPPSFLHRLKEDKNKAQEC